MYLIGIDFISCIKFCYVAKISVVTLLYKYGELVSH